MPVQKIRFQGFLNEFKRRHEELADRPFCWVLGSGASVPSGIPRGGELAYKWLQEMYELEDFEQLPIEQWATDQRLGIPGFAYDRAASFYPWIYQRRFHEHKEQGYASLEQAMDRAEPSFGYFVLAQIMTETAHKVAVTTNFDDLIADALSIYTRKSPLVCGHESLAGYIRADLNRPVIAKIHRDLLLAPLSMPEEIARLPEQWASALTTIFKRFTPIVVGYGGNDGSLMGFLKALDPIRGGIFWCYREESGIDPQIQEVVARHRGKFVPIAGFDELMLALQEKLQLKAPLPELEKVHIARENHLQKQFDKLTGSLTRPGDTPAAEEARKHARHAAASAVERFTSENTWWAWQLKANAEPDPAKRESVYRAGLEQFPQSAELTGNFAAFMETVRQNHEEAESLYRRGLEMRPNNAYHTGSFAVFMHNVRKNHDEAERLYRRALELDPNDAFNTANFAVFMDSVRRDATQAERLYQRAIQLDPSDEFIRGKYEHFRANTRQ